MSTPDNAPSPATEAGRMLAWNDRNPEWWKAQVEARGDIAWQWLVNEFAEARLAALAEVEEAVRETRGLTGFTRDRLMRRVAALRGPNDD